MKCQWCDNEIESREKTVLTCERCGSTAVIAGGHQVTTRLPDPTDQFFDQSLASVQVQSFFQWELPENWEGGQIQCRKCEKIFRAELKNENFRLLFNIGENCRCHFQVYNGIVDAFSNNWRLK